jgi:hypothetical protein
MMRGKLGLFLFSDGYGRDGPGSVAIGHAVHNGLDEAGELLIAIKPAGALGVIFKLD